MNSNFQKLPSFSFAIHPVSDPNADLERVIRIHRGEPGYNDCGLYVKGSVRELNTAFDVTPAQAEAMVVGSMFGWNVPGANPDNYDENGEIKM